LEKVASPRWRVLVGGDDILLQGPKTLDFCEVLKQLGFFPKPVMNAPYRATFYSGFFVPTSAGMCLTPLVGRMFLKLGMSVKPVDEGWQHGVLLGQLAVYHHVPSVCKVLQLLLERYPAKGRVAPKHNYLTPHKLPVYDAVESYHALDTFYPDFEAIMALLYIEYRDNVGDFVSVALDGLLEHE
jgi:hypothetical protein